MLQRVRRAAHAGLAARRFAAADSGGRVLACGGVAGGGGARGETDDRVRAEREHPELPFVRYAQRRSRGRLF